MRMLFEDWLPDPFAVATWIEKSFTTADPLVSGGAFSSRTTLTNGSFSGSLPWLFPGNADDNKQPRPARGGPAR
jgi:hypothetical protein